MGQQFRTENDTPCFIVRMADATLATESDPFRRARVRSMRAAAIYYGARGDEILPDACERYVLARMPLVEDLREWNRSGRRARTGDASPAKIGAVFLLGAAAKIARAGEDGTSVRLHTGLERFAMVMARLEHEGGPQLVAAAKAIGVTPCD